jgi:eukaryotic-like serine/threonine-protein kinase
VSVIESTVDGRYQVITRIASGGMGGVYRAHDAVLDREVALKVLHPQFAGDRGFVDRFRREARAAAVLNHPNIVGVYDWGATDGVYFMIMEFVRGHNLRALLLEYGHLDPAQVVDVCQQVLSALDHAHGHGIVHRDIKPENILIAPNGVVKVADFGLARAYADSSISQADGTVTGTVQYLAPEQVQGEPADPRTDLYAMGVVAFELLTGRAPFSGETSLAIAYKHLSNRVPPPSSILPTVPPALDRAVVHATEREREDRPASARALRDEIALAGMSLAAGSTVGELATQIPSTEFVPDERAPTVTIPRAMSKRARRRRRLRLIVGLVALLTLLGTGAWAVWTYAVPHYANVPALRGLTVEQAAARLKAAGLSWRPGEAEYSTSVDTGLVVRTRPPAKTRIRKNTEVVLVTSKGPEIVPVPQVRGETEQAAKDELRGRGLQVKVKEAFSDTVPEGRVIGQNPDAGQKIEKGSVVTITVSKGLPPVEVPNVVGAQAADARTTLQTAGLKVNEVDQFSNTVPRGEVIATEPPAGTSVRKGDTVTMRVSKGPRTFPMPDVTGMSTEDAVAQLQSAGLKVLTVVIPGTTGNFVAYQQPEPGTTVEQGQQVKIYVTGP